MRPTLLLLLFAFAIQATSQETITLEDLRFYKNGAFRNLKNLEFYVIKNADTLACEIISDSLIMPRVDDTFNLMVRKGKQTYVFEDLDGSRIFDGCSVTFGVEKYMKYLLPVKAAAPDMGIYTLNHHFPLVQIKNKGRAEEVCFINFAGLHRKEGNKETYSLYTSSIILKYKKGLELQ